MDACGGVHYWARELTKLGHTVRLMAAQFVNPYRKSGKNDANDAEAICEAVGRPNMRFVPVNSDEQQAVLMMHRTRNLMVCLGAELGAEAAVGALFLGLSQPMTRRNVLVWVACSRRDGGQFRQARACANRSPKPSLRTRRR